MAPRRRSPEPFLSKKSEHALSAEFWFFGTVVHSAFALSTPHSLHLLRRLHARIFSALCSTSSLLHQEEPGTVRAGSSASMIRCLK